MPLKIFVSYRHDDIPGPKSGGHAHHLKEELARRFGGDNVFIDVDTLEPGVPWQDAIDAYLAECDVLLVLIGEEWLTITDAKGGAASTTLTMSTVAKSKPLLSATYA
jgi:TIR domain